MNKRIKLGVYWLLVLVLIAAPISCSKSSKSIPPESKKPPAAENSKWYVQFSAHKQRSTAYTEERGAPVAADGSAYFLGGIAVHPRYPANAGGDPRQPLIPFGTEIFLDEPVVVQGQKYNTLKVMDTGDINYSLWPGHPYWFDIYYGPADYNNNASAQKYGIPLTDYHWYEEWR